MTRMLGLVTGVALVLSACGGSDKSQTLAASPAEQTAQETTADTTALESTDMPEKVEKSEEQWCSVLTEEQYRVLREKGTERAFTGELLKNTAKGVYACAGCGAPLFHSDHKFDSGTGWPSYFQPFNDTNIATKEDRNHGMLRTEVLCARCDGHLGHVFPDGPDPTGMRYCINSVSLKFVPEEEAQE